MAGAVFSRAIRAAGLASIVAWMLLLPPAGWAQTSRRNVDVSGQIDGVSPGADLRVELQGNDARYGSVLATVGLDGTFEFARVPEGPYEVLVKSARGDVLESTYVTVGAGTNVIQLRLPEKRDEEYPGGTVSIKQLQRKIPRRAEKEYRESLTALRKGDTRVAETHLQSALALAPDYMEAHNELGLCRLQEQDIGAAMREFQTAADLDPGAAGPASNLSAALFMLKRFPEAEASARRAIKLDPALTKARYLLGMSLHAEKRFDREMLEDLKKAADEFPQARLALADALVQLGRKPEAALQLKQYLSDPGATQKRPEVEAWLADLQRSQAVN